MYWLVSWVSMTMMMTMCTDTGIATKRECSSVVRRNNLVLTRTRHAYCAGTVPTTTSTTTSTTRVGEVADTASAATACIPFTQQSPTKHARIHRRAPVTISLRMKSRHTFCLRFLYVDHNHEINCSRYLHLYEATKATTEALKLPGLRSCGAGHVRLTRE